MPLESVDVSVLQEFERGLDPRHPERSRVPAQVLGYGEISTVLSFGEGASADWAYKRLAMFTDEEEARRYEALHHEYVNVLETEIGVRVPQCATARVVNSEAGIVVVYIIQEKMAAESVGHKIIHHLEDRAVLDLVLVVLRETAKVFEYNRLHQRELEIGFDGQISNWAISGLDPGAATPGKEIRLAYLDTSTPLLRRNGAEQLDPELFLRNAPSFLVWIIRRLFLEDVLKRYYDRRQVAVDMVANFYKEQRPELVPGLVETVNAFFGEAIHTGQFEPLTVSEIRAYYREDAWIWRIYLAARKIDRGLQRLLGRPYPYVLPGRTKR